MLGILPSCLGAADNVGSGTKNPVSPFSRVQVEDAAFPLATTRRFWLPGRPLLSRRSCGLVFPQCTAVHSRRTHHAHGFSASSRHIGRTTAGTDLSVWTRLSAVDFCQEPPQPTSGPPSLPSCRQNQRQWRDVDLISGSRDTMPFMAGSSTTKVECAESS